MGYRHRAYDSIYRVIWGIGRDDIYMEGDMGYRAG